MCDANFNGNKVTVCQVGDLTPGQTYRTPKAMTMMVLRLPDGPTIGSILDGFTAVACINRCDEEGQVFAVPNSTRLGRDRAGRLYASRSLNNPNPNPITGDLGLI